MPPATLTNDAVSYSIHDYLVHFVVAADLGARAPIDHTATRALARTASATAATATIFGKGMDRHHLHSYHTLKALSNTYMEAFAF